MRKIDISKKLALACSLAIISLFLLGCEPYPKDPHKSFHTIQKTGTMKIGVIEHPPFTIQEEKNSPETYDGLEIWIMREFAAQIGGVTPQFERLSEAKAMEALKNHELHLVVGGLTKANPYKKIVAFTRPYLKFGDSADQHYVMAIAKGENHLMVVLEQFLKQHKDEIRARHENYKGQSG